LNVFVRHFFQSNSNENQLNDFNTFIGRNRGVWWEIGNWDILIKKKMKYNLADIFKIKSQVY